MAISSPTPAQAAPVVGPFLPGFIGPLDDSIAILVGAHPNEQTTFFDTFSFFVSSSAALFGITFPIQVIDASLLPEDAATITGLALYDLSSNILSFDGDGSDGYAVSALVPGAGVFALVVAGVGGSGDGRYVGLLSSVRVVDEPTSLLLGLGGLALLAGVRRRA